jgi:hypothetical protein
MQLRRLSSLLAITSWQLPFHVLERLLIRSISRSSLSTQSGLAGTNVTVDAALTNLTTSDFPQRRHCDHCQLAFAVDDNPFVNNTPPALPDAYANFFDKLNRTAIGS